MARPIKIEKNKLFWENVKNEQGCIDFNFAMLIPQFIGQKIRYVNGTGEDISSVMCNAAGFLKVDADYESVKKAMIIGNQRIGLPHINHHYILIFLRQELLLHHLILYRHRVV